MQHKSNLTSGDVNKTTACNRGVRGNQKSNGDVTKCKFVKKVRGIISSSSSSSSVFEFKKYLYRILYSIHFLRNLVHFVDLWSGSISAVWWWCSSKVSHVGHSSHSTSRHSTHSWHTSHSRHSSSASLCSSVGSRDDRSLDIFNLLLLCFIFFSYRIRVGVDPINGLFHCILYLLFVIFLDQVFEFSIIQCVPHLIRHILQIILCLNRLPLLLILCFVFLSVSNNFVNLLLTQSSLVGVDGDLLNIIRVLLISSRDTQNTICVQIKGNLNLRHTTWSRRDIHQFEFTQIVVILRQLSLSLKYLNQNTRLVVRVSGKCLIGLAWDCLISLDQFGHDTACSLDSQR